jgi:WD40 repeat protein
MGELLVVSSFEGGAYSFWSANDGSLLLSQPPGRIDSLAFSPDGSLVAFDRPDGGIEIRTTSDLRLLTVLAGDNETTARMLVFLKDGKALAEATVGGGLTLWDLDSASWAKLACTAAGRTLTKDERSRLIPPGIDVDPCRPG